MNCFPAMTGKEMEARIHGTVESILFARAISIAPADHGLVKSTEGFGAAGLPGWRVEGAGCKREGERIGEENERR